MPYRMPSFQKSSVAYHDKSTTYGEIVYLITASLVFGSIVGFLAVAPTNAPPTVCQENTSCFEKNSNN